MNISKANVVGVVGLLSPLLLSASTSYVFASPNNTSVYKVPMNLTKSCMGNNKITEKLNDFLASVPSGTNDKPNIIDFGYHTCFNLDDDSPVKGVTTKGLTLLGKSNIIIRGSSTFKWKNVVSTKVINGKSYGDNRALLNIQNSSNITINGTMSFMGKRAYNSFNSLAEHDHNISILGDSHNINISKTTLRNAGGDNIYVAPIGDKIPSNININKNTMDNPGRNNFSVVGGNNINLTNNILRNADYWSVDLELESPKWTINNIRVSNNRVSGEYRGFLSISEPDGVLSMSNNGVNNILINGNNVGRSLTNSEFVSINSSAKLPRPTNNVSIRSNKFAVNRYGISVSYIDGLQVLGNYGVTYAGGTSGTSKDKSPLLSVGNGVINTKITANTFISGVRGKHTSVWELQKDATTNINSIKFARNRLN